MSKAERYRWVVNKNAGQNSQSKVNSMSISCTYCKKSFESIIDLTVHMNESNHVSITKESNVAALSCLRCGCSFENLQDLCLVCETYPT